jgi:hypothetical protein
VAKAVKLPLSKNGYWYILPITSNIFWGVHHEAIVSSGES